jgi:hypothetical protein
MCVWLCRLALAWFNRQDVREAIHAPSVSELQWQPCSDTLRYDFTAISMIPHHLHALEHGASCFARALLTQLHAKRCHKATQQRFA